MTITEQDIERAREWWDNNAPLYSPADALAEYAVHVTAERDAEIARLRGALKLGLEYWRHRQQRYKNRHPAWVTVALAALDGEKSDG